MQRFLFVTPLLFVVLVGCNKSQTESAQPVPTDTGNAPASAADVTDGNLAQPVPPVSPSGQSYAPPTGDSYNAQDYDQDATYGETAQAPEPPPPLPDYSQPPAPGDNYVWNPGYWNYASSGYYWVPGAWVLAPYVGALWTPPWWGYDNGVYRLHSGYWGPHIGYYGGINYGFGYTGRGYYGAHWNNGRLDYNRAVTNVDAARVHNVYNHEVPNSRGNRVSYNGGRGGINVRPTPQELAAVHDRRSPPVPAQVQHTREASANRAQFAKAGGGAKPAALVASRPLPTSYKAPAERPSPVETRTAERPAPEAPAHALPNGHPGAQATRVPGSQLPPRPIQRAEPRPAPQARAQEPRPAPQARAQQPRPAPQTRAPEPRPAAPPRPAPQARAPEPRPAAPPRPAPQARAPEPRPAAPPRPAPQARAPEPRPAAPPRPAPRPKEEHKE